MGDKKPSPKGGSGAGSPEATRLESAEDLRRAVAAQLLGTVIEANALPDDYQSAPGTRVETVDEIRKSPNPIVQQFLQGSEVGPIPI